MFIIVITETWVNLVLRLRRDVKYVSRHGDLEPCTVQLTLTVFIFQTHTESDTKIKMTTKQRVVHDIHDVHTNNMLPPRARVSRPPHNHKSTLAWRSIGRVFFLGATPPDPHGSPCGLDFSTTLITSCPCTRLHAPVILTFSLFPNFFCNKFDQIYR